MSTPRTLRDAIYITVHRNKKDINQIAEECGVSTNILYRYCNEEDTSSFADLPLRRLLPLMKCTKDTTILDYLEMRCGRIAFEVPRVMLSKKEENQLVNDYQTATINAVSFLNKFLQNPNEENLREVTKALEGVIGESAKTSEYCKIRHAAQEELFINSENC